MHSIPPRITEKSYRPRASNRTMVGVLEPTPVGLRSFAPKASNHQVMKPSSRNRADCLALSEARREHKASPNLRSGWMQIGHTHLLSKRTEEKCFLDIPSHRTSPLIGLTGTVIRLEFTVG